jgi:hypothetical protein
MATAMSVGFILASTLKSRVAFRSLDKFNAAIITFRNAGRAGGGEWRSRGSAVSSTQRQTAIMCALQLGNSPFIIEASDSYAMIARLR